MNTSRTTDVSPPAHTSKQAVERLLFLIGSILFIAQASATEQADLIESARLLHTLDRSTLESLVVQAVSVSQSSRTEADAEAEAQQQPSQAGDAPRLSPLRALQRFLALTTPPEAAGKPVADETGSSVPASDAPANSRMTPIVPAPLTTARWDSGRRLRSVAALMADDSLRYGSARIAGERRSTPVSPEEKVIRSTPATGWIPRDLSRAQSSEYAAQPSAPSLTRRWELLSRFDSGSRPAAAAAKPEE